jgi:hypothetical protein
VEGDALDQAGQDLGRTRPRCARHPGIMEIGFLGRYQDRAGSVPGGVRIGASGLDCAGVSLVLTESALPPRRVASNPGS